MGIDVNIHLGHYVTIANSEKSAWEFAEELNMHPGDKCFHIHAECDEQILMLGNTISLHDVARSGCDPETPVNISELKVSTQLRNAVIEFFGRENCTFNFGLVHELV